VGEDPGAEVTFVATPAGAVAAASAAVLSQVAATAVVTDVAGVKTPIVTALSDPRFVGGHPMAGSEQEGVDGADATLFEGATWVLTPTDSTDPGAYALVLAVVSSLGADVVAMPASRHDDMVAMVSHVPHLTAAALMTLAADAAAEHATILRLAAGGFRDMTRIAAGHPAIWPDLCLDNRTAITTTLDALMAAVGGLRVMVAEGDRTGLLAVLERAREARMNLPARSLHAEALVEIRVPVPDRPGVLAEVTTVLGELNVNIYDLEIVHSAEGPRGVLVLAVDIAQSDLGTAALVGLGYHPARRPLAP
jgi:prephenate dehydrogenase